MKTINIVIKKSLNYFNRSKNNNFRDISIWVALSFLERQ